MKTTITAEQISEVSRRTGASVLDVRRCMLGMPMDNTRTAVIVPALIDAGVDAGFLHRLHGASAGGAAPHTDPAKAAEIRARLLRGRP